MGIAKDVITLIRPKTIIKRISKFGVHMKAPDHLKLAKSGKSSLYVNDHNIASDHHTLKSNAPKCTTECECML